jgi:hypothetical protein
VSIADSNFPKTAGFSTHDDIYWEVNLIHFDKNHKALLIEITDYHPANILVFSEQSSKSKVSAINFQSFDWELLKPFLNRYAPNDFDHLLKENEEVRSRKSIQKSTEAVFLPDFIPEIRDVEPVLYQEKFTCYFKDAIFNLGYVSLKKKFDFFDNPIDFKIFNSEILPEFNYIKPFFSKAFNGKKKFKVNTWIEITNGALTKTQASSPEIKHINESLIDSIKRLRTLKIPLASIKQDIDKSLFTPDEVFLNTDDDSLDGNVFKQNGKDILQTILDFKNVRNKKQLEYISGYKHSPQEKIRFTLNPLFGFLFLIEGETMYHYCWELLNSHATYLWSFEKMTTPDFYLNRVEASVNIIRDMGRNKYKQAYRQNILDPDITLSVINHKHSNSAFKDSFVYWKHRFKECLV